MPKSPIIAENYPKPINSDLNLCTSSKQRSLAVVKRHMTHGVPSPSNDLYIVK